MGNNLCKERIDRASDSKNPIDRILGRCAQICPNSNKNQNFWNKHVFETCPPQQNQPQRSDSWRNETLSVPAVEKMATNNNDVVAMPVAPPRKKRGSSFAGMNPVRNGFKDVFGNDDRRVSRDSCISREKSVVDGPPNEKQKNLSVSSYDIPSNDEFSDFSNEEIRKSAESLSSPLHKLGNRKSDKFFGENLSDLSDEQLENISEKKLSPASEDILDKFIASNVTNNEVESKIQKNTEKTVRAPPPDPPKRKISTEKQVINKDEIDKSSSLDRKAEFLMAMLNAETESDEKYYANRTPIEEPPMVMVKRQRGCICCDDDDALRKHLHRHEQKVAEADKSGSLVSVHSNSENAPMKPVRDFTKYRQSMDSTDTSLLNLNITDVAEIEKPSRNKYKRSLSREDLPTPPPLPKRNIKEETVFNYEALAPPITNKTKSVYVTPPSISLTLSPSLSPNSMKVKPPPIPPKPQTPENKTKLQRYISMPVTQKEEESKGLMPEPKLEVFKKCKSSNSFLTQELMNELVKKSYGFGYNEDFHSEHHFDDHDGSGLVSPSSKLESRKIVLTKSNSIENPVINENDDNKTMFTIGQKEIQVSEVDSSNISDEHIKKPIEITSEQVVEKVESKPVQEKHTTKVEPPVEHKFKTHENFLVSNIDSQNLEHILESSGLNIDSLSSVLDDIYKTNKTILEDFQNYLEESRDETESQTSSKKILHRVQSQTESENSKRNELLVEDNLLDKLSVCSTTAEEFDLDKEEDIDLIVDTEESEKDEQSDNEDVSELRDTKLSNKHLKGTHLSHIRRDSIEDVDQWFTKHLDMPIKNRSVSDIIHGNQKGRRGSEGMIVYDTSTIFPFSKPTRERTLSESAEFFDYNNTAKLNTPNNKTTPIIINNIIEKNQDQDHSKLLRILQKESPNKQQI